MSVSAAAVAEALRLCQVDDDESEPYKSRYAAADLLQAASKTLEAQLASSPTDGTARHDFEQQLATLQARRGLALVETDMLADAEAAMAAALPILERRPLQQPAVLLEAYNAKGALASNRGAYEVAIPWLQKAEQLYAEQKPAAGGGAASPAAVAGAPSPAAASTPQRPPTAPATPASSSAAEAAPAIALPSPVSQLEQLEGLHTSTLFYLAQVYGLAGQKDRSAGYCAATLHRQLISGTYRPSEWATNCLALSSYFVGERAFAPAQFCLSAAAAVAAAASTAGADNGGGEPSEEDLPANVRLAWGRLYLARLVAAHEQVVEKQALETAEPTASISELRFPTLDIPPLESCPAGAAALAKDFDGARTLFNLALPHFKAGLEYFKLDGWVTEHCNVLMEISNLYRCLAGFESDSRRVCAMHKQRAMHLEPLSGQLNPEFYPGLARSIDLELGNIYRELVEVKENDGQSDAKVTSAGRLATKYYQAFIDSFRLPDGKLPDRIDEDNQSYFLRASFSLGRVLHKCDGVDGSGTGRNTTMMEAAHKHLLWASDYVRRNDVTEFSREAGLAGELAALVAEKIDLVNRLQVQ